MITVGKITPSLEPLQSVLRLFRLLPSCPLRLDIHNKELHAVETTAYKSLPEVKFEMVSSMERDDEVVSLELPAPPGWTKKYVLKKSGTPKKNEIIFTSPTGEEINNRRSLDQYLRSHPGGPAVSEFDWSTGEAPRRSARISERTRVALPAEFETPTKRRRTSITKKEKKMSEKTEEIDMKDPPTTEGENPKVEEEKVEEAPQGGDEKIDKGAKVENDENEKPKEDDVTGKVEEPLIEGEKVDDGVGEENQPEQIQEDQKEENDESSGPEHIPEPAVEEAPQGGDEKIDKEAKMENEEKTKENERPKEDDVTGKVEENQPEQIQEDQKEENDESSAPEHMTEPEAEEALHGVDEKIDKEAKVENEEKTEENEKLKEEDETGNVEEPQIEGDKVDDRVGEENQPEQIKEDQKEENDESSAPEHVPEPEPETKPESEIKDKVVTNANEEQKDSSRTYEVSQNVEGEAIDSRNHGEEVKV
ncbi:hypothetical protein SAY87_013772 [Trapa incisa]|uniref:MBD domain-containing protein n=1 Tax=Trapa incisa TaxID=236973 RepID=A0AAN7KC16_9MYRT|nr:hypothetical protein SAY87_013772 [Trapa incisa]